MEALLPIERIKMKTKEMLTKESKQKNGLNIVFSATFTLPRFILNTLSTDTHNTISAGYWIIV